jgi:hypothetical protein
MMNAAAAVAAAAVAQSMAVMRDVMDDPPDLSEPCAVRR